jgi:calcium-dependent protein kinase
VNILKKLDHPNIVKYYETYEDSKYFYMVMEYVQGGEMFKLIAEEKSKVFNEQLAKIYMRKLFMACNHMHAQGIIHRDIKPSNIMICKTSGDLKIIDFGLSTNVQDGPRSVVGTPYFMAPEVEDAKYSTECDMWALGVLLYMLLCGSWPFQDVNRIKAMVRLKEASFTFHDE